MCDARNEARFYCMEEIELKFRDNLLHLRQQRNMTQEQLAMLLGVSRQSVAKWEAGQSTPEVDKLIKMADLFDCSLDELVSGDLTQRVVKPSEVVPSDVPAADVCGYDNHMRKFARSIATGVALVIGGIAFAVVADALLSEALSDAITPAVIILFIAAGLGLILPAGVGHSAFTKAHPFVEDFYTAEQRSAEQRSFTKFLTGGIIVILLGLVAVAVSDAVSNELAQAAGAAIMLLAIAAGVWCLVYGGIIHGMTDIENYNRECAEEQRQHDDPRIGRACGIIMLVATAIGLLMLFASQAAADAGNATVKAVCSYFWVSWVIGGIACAIASVALKDTTEN